MSDGRKVSPTDRGFIMRKELVVTILMTIIVVSAIVFVGLWVRS
mgnify:CR=1 FL=1